jgi:hypothetical protein
MGTLSSTGDPNLSIQNLTTGINLINTTTAPLQQLQQQIQNAQSATYTTPPENDSDKRLFLVLNTLFKGRVIVYHNTMMRRSEYLLTKQEATQYIQNYFPEKFLGWFIESSTIFDPLLILAFFRAMDGASYFEIREPHTAEEFGERIDGISWVAANIHTFFGGQSGVSGYSGTATYPYLPTTTTIPIPLQFNIPPQIQKQHRNLTPYYGDFGDFELAINNCSSYNTVLTQT